MLSAAQAGDVVLLAGERMLSAAQAGYVVLLAGERMLSAAQAGDVVLLVGERMLSAAQAGDVVLLRQLLDKGHSINETNYDCVTPLHEACLADRLECVQFLLLCGANVSLLLNIVM